MNNRYIKTWTMINDYGNCLLLLVLSNDFLCPIFLKIRFNF